MCDSSSKRSTVSTHRIREETKTLLRRIGLYATAKKIRDSIHSVRFLRRNIRIWQSGADDGLDIPPLELIGLVAGPRDIQWFLEGGKLAADTITVILQKNGIRLDGLRTVLDFGCGSGRTLRHFKLEALSTKFWGADYNPKLVEWCAKNLSFARFEKNNLAPPLNFQAGTFDLIYALSVFTHMPEDLQIAWIEELWRILSPGGLLLITTHGERYLSELTLEEQERFLAGNLVVHVAGEVGSNTYGAYHPPGYVQTILCKQFEMVDFVPEGAKGNPYQDLFLFRKPVR